MSIPVTSADPYTTDTYAAEWQAALTKLATAYGNQAGGLYLAWQSGGVTTAEWKQLFVMVLVNAVGDGTGIGAGLAARLLHLTHGRPVLPTPPGILDVPAELDRLTTSVATLADVLDTEGDPRPRITRLATSEPLNAAQQAAVRVFDQHKVTGWRRGVRPDACELCHWLAKTHLDPAGYVYPTSKPMYQHPGCTCHPIPVTITVRTAE